MTQPNTVNVGTIGHIDHGRRARVGGRRNGITSGLAYAASSMTVSSASELYEDKPITPETYQHNIFATHPRNSPCPCNSGKKWKKCHMNAKR